jgi:membrane fusion protein, copper/silver efflux system
LRVLRHAGELVDGTGATALFEIADASAPMMRLDVPAADLVRLAVDSIVHIRLDAAPAQTLDGKISYVSPSVDTATGLGSARTTIVAVPEFSLKLGLAGTVEVTLAGSAGAEQIVVPAAAVRRSLTGGEEVVVCETANKQTHAAVRAITVVARHRNDVIVSDGVKSHDRVVVTHVLGLDDGALLDDIGAGPADKEEGSAVGSGSGSAKATP